MTEKLHRSYSMEKTKGADGVTTSGSFSFWEDNPVSPLDIGDEFQPVPDGPKLRVGKVSISDSVIGERSFHVLPSGKVIGSVVAIQVFVSDCSILNTSLRPNQASSIRLF